MTQLDETLEQFDNELEAINMRSHWRALSRPRPAWPAKLWKWDDIYRVLIRAGEVVTLGSDTGTGRRTLHLITPGTEYTSPNVQMCVQLVKAGEEATAHKHTAAATRFVVQGEGAYTTVDGEPVPLAAGDYVTTPSMSFHDHANKSSEPIIWLDILDSPFVTTLGAKTFGERFPTPMQPWTRPVGASRAMAGSARPAGRSLHPAHVAAAYPWSEIRPALDNAAADGPPDPCDGIMLDYVNPVTGGHLLPSLGSRIQMLLPRMHTQPHRHTTSAIYHVVEGEGVTVVGDERLEWSKGDCFTVPSWEWHAHEQRGSEPAILFSAHDQPILEAFDFYREEREED
jgi:gentisate 1,2-dioxygenase